MTWRPERSRSISAAAGMRARIWMMCWRDEVRRCRCRSRCLTRRRSTGRRGLKRSTPTAWPHGRGKFKELEEIFPVECGQVMEAIRKVYWYDDRTKGMSDQERLEYHRKHSGPVMKELREWIDSFGTGGSSPIAVWEKRFSTC